MTKLDKVIGPIRKIDDLGRVVVPKEYREILDIKEDDKIEFIIRNNKLELKKYEGEK